MLVKNPGFAFIAIVSIAIGVGVNAAMFSLADGLVLRPLQVPRANEIVAVSAIAPRADAAALPSNTLLSYPDYADLRDRAQSFEGVVAYRVEVNSFAPHRDEPPQTTLGLIVSGNFFDVLGLRPALGRFFLPDEDRVPGRDAVMVLAHRTWADHFGSDPDVIGRRVRLGGLDFTVIGVAPSGFSGMHLALPPAFYVPLAVSPSLAGAPPGLLQRRDARGLDVRGRLKPGVSLDQAREEARIIAADLERTYPDTNRNFGLLVRTAFDARLDERGQSAPTAFMMLTLALVVLVVACANVAGLLMSRAPAREREIALRLAIGGGRFRVARQLVTESVLLALGGGVAGLAMALGSVVLLQRLPVLSDIGVRLTFELDRRAVVFGVAVAAASTLLSSVVPAWRAARTSDLAHTLRTGRTDPRRLGRLWGRNGLVAGQIALSLMLLTVTVFLMRAFQAELTDPGFRTSGILLSNFQPDLAGYDQAGAEAFYDALKERARALPGVTSTGMTSVMPLNQDWRNPVAILPEGTQLPRGAESAMVLSSRIDEGYLDTMTIPVVRGRGILATDRSGAPLAVLVNQAMARRYWPGQEAVGKRIRFVSREGQPWAEVVGVTADNKHNWIGEGPTPWLYIPQRQVAGTRSTLLVATSGSAARLAPSLRDIVRDLDPNMPISGVRTMEEFYDGNATGIVRALTQTTGMMGVLALALAVIGLYGLVAYAAARRTREIGIRMAVGAPASWVLRMVLRHGLVLCAAGVGMGIAGSVAAGGLLRGVFPITAGIDAVTYLIVVPLLVAVALLAAYFPARRAARTDPLVALRQE